MKCEQYFLKVKDKLNNKKFRGELRSGLRCCNQNQNIPSSDHLLDTQQSLGAQPHYKVSVDLCIEIIQKQWLTWN